MSSVCLSQWREDQTDGIVTFKALLSEPKLASWLELNYHISTELFCCLFSPTASTWPLNTDVNHSRWAFTHILSSCLSTEPGPSKMSWPQLCSPPGPLSLHQEKTPKQKRDSDKGRAPTPHFHCSTNPKPHRNQGSGSSRVTPEQIPVASFPPGECLGAPCLLSWGDSVSSTFSKFLEHFWSIFGVHWALS